MTPTGWALEQFVLLGVAWMFGGLLPAAALALALRRWVGRERSLGVAMIAWGLGNLAVAALIGLYLRVDTVLLTVPAPRCEAAVDAQGRPVHTLTWPLQRAGAPLREVVLQGQPGECPLALQAERLRVRRAALDGPRHPLTPDPGDDNDPALVMLLWGGFGLFGLLFGSAWLANARGGRAAAEPPPPGWRGSIGSLIAQLGGLVLLAAVVLPFFLPGTTMRGLQFGLRGAAAAMACFLLANLLHGSGHPARLVLLLVAGGALLGMADVLQHGR
jgi:hypothetical protein